MSVQQSARWLFLVLLGVSSAVTNAAGDDGLILHYTFDKDLGSVAKDLSSRNNDGKIVNAQYLAEVDGRRGVLRFDGTSSFVDCGDAESLQVAGDMSFEMWVRLNKEVSSDWGFIFGDYPPRSFYFTYAHFHTLMMWYHTGEEPMLLPVDRNIIGEKWSHIAVVFEYPRCRFYRNGELVRDAYMPVPGVNKLQRTHKFIGGGGGVNPANDASPIDLDEIRFYRRALGAPEVAAHAKDREIEAPSAVEIAVEPNWYRDELVLRASCKGREFEGKQIELGLQRGDHTDAVTPKPIALVEAFEGCGRYVASATFPLAGLKDQSVDGFARIKSADGGLVSTALRHAHLSKPDWIDNREGYFEEVPKPWTAVEAESKSDGTVEARVWDRRYVFGPSPFVQQIESGGNALLAAPINLSGTIDGAQVTWKDGENTLKDHSKIAATIEQHFPDASADLTIRSNIEFDGFVRFDCTLAAKRPIKINKLLLQIPLNNKFASLCYGQRVLPEDSKVLINAWYSGAVRGDLSFRFSPDIWLGNEERGLCWSAESDEDWTYADKQKAIEILPRDQTTTFLAHWIDVPTTLEAGQSLQYTFALEATPVKPRLRDAWDLRIVRSDPYGNDLDLPDRMTDGKPTLQAYADAGVRHLFINANDIFPWPTTDNPKISRLIARLSDSVHAHGLKLYQYVIHERMPVHVPEFDIYGLNMSNRPIRTFTPGGYPLSWKGQSGPVAMRWGANSQGCVMFCAKSKALQDAYLYSLARRLDQYGEDGVYLDGTGDVVPCSNADHGCGYRAKDGVVHQTYPVFANREFIRRLYVLVKKRRPDAVIDLHCSGLYFPPVLAYADVIWTGEQWYHQANQDLSRKYVAENLSLDGFRTEFTGYQIGVAAETLAYRLGPTSKVAATALLHDIPVRPRTQETEEFSTMCKLWKMRDEFGAKEAEKLFYWNNEQYARVTPAKCYTTLLKHPRNGVLALVSNRSPLAQDITVRFDLKRLGLGEQALNVLDVLSGKTMQMNADGELSLSLGSEQWTYVWLRPG